jgi:hypothetical protein
MGLQGVEEAAMREPNLEKLNALVGKLVGDLGISLGGASILLGDRLGLYKAMADGAVVTPSELAKKTGLHERYVREWLSGQAASGYIDYHPENNAFSLSAEQAMAFAEEGSPAFFAGAFDVVQSTYLDEPKVAEAFRTGKGLGWHEDSKCLFSGTERFFRPGYSANLVSNWIPTLEGVEAKLKAGARVADVGCGHGASTIVMAQAYPNSEFFGFDYLRLWVRRDTTSNAPAKKAAPLRRTPWLARPRVRTHFFRGGSRCIQRRPARTAIRVHTAHAGRSSWQARTE